MRSAATSPKKPSPLSVKPSPQVQSSLPARAAQKTYQASVQRSQSQSPVIKSGWFSFS